MTFLLEVVGVGLKVEVVKDEPCPVCGSYSGHKNPRRNYPNRPKVCAEDGWWWKCYNPVCPVAFYNPEARKVEFLGGVVQSYSSDMVKWGKGVVEDAENFIKEARRTLEDIAQLCEQVAETLKTAKFDEAESELRFITRLLEEKLVFLETGLNNALRLLDK